MKINKPTQTPVYFREEHRVHKIVYYLVWTVKRRKLVLTGSLATECRKLIEAKSDELHWKLFELVIEPDYIYAVVQVWPSVSVDEAVREFKRTTARLRRKHTMLTRLPSLWNRNYFATVSPPPVEDIQVYLQEQKGR